MHTKSSKVKRWIWKVICWWFKIEFFVILFGSVLRIGEELINYSKGLGEFPDIASDAIVIILTYILCYKLPSRKLAKIKQEELKEKGLIINQEIKEKQQCSPQVRSADSEIESPKNLTVKEPSLISNTNNDLKREGVKKEIDTQSRKNEVKKEVISQAEYYLSFFKDIKEFDLGKEQSEEFIKKIKRTREVDYERFMKPSGTTDRPRNFIVFDLETTGLNAQRNEIIEIGAIKYRSDVPVEYFHSYIKPKKKISEKITSITGIKNETVDAAPTIEEILPKFIEFIDDDVLVAHNSDFDTSFILQNLYDLGYRKIKNKAIDTLKLSRQKLRKYEWEKDRGVKLESYKLEDLKYEFGMYGLSSHNALDDCKVCAFVYQKIKEQHGDVCYAEIDYIEI